MPLKDVSFEELSKKTKGYSGADIEGVCKKAGILALRGNIDARVVTMKDFLDALEIIKPSLDDDTIKYYDEIGGKIMRSVNKIKKDLKDSPEFR